MSKFNQCFRKRLGISENETLTFDWLEDILNKSAATFPFENLCIISNRIRPITKDNLADKILVNKEGGLCYELNPLLYFFLQENGFDVSLILANVYNNETKSWSTLGNTHVAVLVYHEGQTYLLETGFGGNLPLKPVPLTGETITSSNGMFRVEQMQGHEEFDHVLKLKLKDKDAEWRIGHAFHSKRPLKDFSKLNEIQTVVSKSASSHFNRGPLITQLTRDGNVTLTDTTFTQWKNGSMSKQTIDRGQFEQLAKHYFGIKISPPSAK